MVGFCVQRMATRVVARHADVAADALADVREAPLLDLAGQERVGDRGARRADHVEHALGEEPHHRVGRREAPDADDRLRRERLQAADVGLAVPLVAEARRQRVEVPVADHQVPHVGVLADEPEELLDLGALEAVRADQLVHAEPAGDGRAPVDDLERLLEHLAQEPCAIVERASVGVRARVVAAREELLEERDPVAGVDVDEVVARRERAADGGAVPAPEVDDVGRRHRARLHGVRARHGEVRGRERRRAHVEVRRGQPREDELAAGERAVRVDALDEAGVHRDVAVVPEHALDERRDVGGVVELDLLRADDGPAALRLDAAHLRVRGRVAVAHAVAVRHLEEAVPGRHRPEPHRLEEHVVAGIAHGPPA